LQLWGNKYFTRAVEDVDLVAEMKKYDVVFSRDISERVLFDQSNSPT
jgi:hypothetical protein